MISSANPASDIGQAPRRQFLGEVHGDLTGLDDALRAPLGEEAGDRDAVENRAGAQDGADRDDPYAPDLCIRLGRFGRFGRFGLELGLSPRLLRLALDGLGRFARAPP